MVSFAANLGEFPMPILCGDGAVGTILEARTALCVDCTNGGFALFGLPIPTASCSYVVCISATIVLRWCLQRI